MRIGVDLDGVVYEFVDALRSLLIWRGRIVEPVPPATHWSFYKDWGLTTPEFLDILCEGIVFLTGHPTAGAIRGLVRLRNAGHTIHIVTHRSAEAATETWLHTHGVPYDSLTFSEDKTCVPVDVFIDDRKENYDAIEAAGILAFLYDRPWNAGHPGRRVANWAQFTQEVFAL